MPKDGGRGMVWEKERKEGIKNTNTYELLILILTIFKRLENKIH